MGRFDLLDMDDDEREELAKQPAPPPAPSPLASRAPGMSYAAAGAALHEMLADRFRDVDDDGNDPETADMYVFAAYLEETEGRVVVAITPLDYWLEHQAQSDWELEISHLLPADFEQVQESTFLVNSPAATVESVTQELTARGFRRDLRFQAFLDGT